MSPRLVSWFTNLAAFLKSRRGLLFLFLGLVAIGMVLAGTVIRDRIPSHQGRSADEWLYQAVTNQGSLKEVTEAFTKMGPAGVQFLGGALNQKPSSLDEWFLKHHQKIPANLRQALLKPKPQHQQSTILALLERLDTNAAPALPGLLTWLERRGDRISTVTATLPTNGFTIASNMGPLQFRPLYLARPGQKLLPGPPSLALLLPSKSIVQMQTQAVVSARGVVTTNVIVSVQSTTLNLLPEAFQILTNLGGDDPRIITALVNPVDRRNYARPPLFGTNLRSAALRSVPLLLQNADSSDLNRKLTSLGLLRLTLPESAAAHEFMVRQLGDLDVAVFDAAVESLRNTTNDLDRIVPPTVRGLVYFKSFSAATNTPAYKALKEFARHSPLLVVSNLQEAIRVTQPYPDWGAIELLGEVGTTNDVDLALIRSFTEMEPAALRAQALITLGKLTRDNVKIAQGYLIYLDLGRKDWPLFDRIGTLGPAAQVTVPRLIPLLSDENERFIAKAAETLAKIGPGAVSALPALEKLRSHPHLLVREPVEAALRNIGATNIAPSQVEPEK